MVTTTGSKALSGAYSLTGGGLAKVRSGAYSNLREHVDSVKKDFHLGTVEVFKYAYS